MVENVALQRFAVAIHAKKALENEGEGGGVDDVLVRGQAVEQGGG